MRVVLDTNLGSLQMGQALKILLSNDIIRVELYRAAVGFPCLGVFPQLHIGPAQTIMGIDIGGEALY